MEKTPPSYSIWPNLRLAPEYPWINAPQLERLCLIPRKNSQISRRSAILTWFWAISPGFTFNGAPWQSDRGGVGQGGVGWRGLYTPLCTVKLTKMKLAQLKIFSLPGVFPMNTPRLCLKKFFSFLVFFDTERKLQAVESRYLARDQLLRHKLHQAEDKIRDLSDSVSWLEQQRSENMTTIKKRATEMAYLEDQLEKTLKEKKACREKMTALQLTHRKLVGFLEKTNTLPKSS